MKKGMFLPLALALGVLTGPGRAQEAPALRSARPAFPLTVSVFSESVSLPDFSGFFRKPNLGVRLGTEFTYRTRPGSRVYQTLNLGFYRHRGLHNAWFVSSELGYRKNFGAFFADGTLGGGYLLLRSVPPVYQPTGPGEFTKASPLRHKFMPTLGLGAGYRLSPRASVFARYEVFGLMPIQQDVPVLPHKALHAGARIQF